MRGLDRSGEPLEAYLYQVADNEQCMREWGHQCVVWQTAYNPVAALELLASGIWQGKGVLGPEAFPARPFLDLLPSYDAPWGIRTRRSARRALGRAAAGLMTTLRPAAACSRYTREMRGASARTTQQAAEILAGLPSPVQAFSGDGSVLPLRIGSRHSELIDAEAAATRARRGLWLVVRSEDHEIELEIARVEPKGAWMARIGLRVLDVRVRPLTRQSPRTRVSETAKVYVLGARSVTAGEHFDGFGRRRQR